MFRTFDGYIKTIVFRKGYKNNINSEPLLEREIAFCIDTKEYYIGTSNGNMKFKEFDLLAEGIDVQSLGHRFFIGLTETGMKKFYKRTL